MRIEYADRKSEKSEVTTAMKIHRRRRDRADVAFLLAVLPGLRRQAACDGEPGGDAHKQRDEDRRVAQ
jgi:hypothetical protein